jgi:hypothetical protein
MSGSEQTYFQKGFNLKKGDEESELLRRQVHGLPLPL